MSLQSLREQALARTRTALLRRQVVLDEALDKAATEARQHATDARNRVVLHEVEQDRDEPGGRYSDAPEGGARLAALEAAAVDAEQAAEDAERDAATTSVHLVFRRISPDEYQQMITRHTAKDGEQFDMASFSTELAERCYLRCETPDREDMDISWRQAQDDMLSHGERERIYSDVISHNRQVVIHPS